MTAGTSALEISALALVALGALALVARIERRLVGPALAVLALGAVLFTPRLRASEASASPRVELTPVLGYAGSAACLGCHPAEHASFGRTYHRTMTQPPSRAAFKAPLDGRPIAIGTRTVRFTMDGEKIQAILPDPDAFAEGRDAPDVTRPLALLTGSHREQAFWVAGDRPGDLRPVPVVWLVREARFVPRIEAFLTPPDTPLPPVHWGSSCIACHAVAGEPRRDPVADTWSSRVAELGIACEACHGPGALHATERRDPVGRWVQRARKAPDPTITNPARLSPERSAALCGQCHAYAFPRDEAGWWESGYARSFRAGDSLGPSRTLITRETMAGGGPIVDAPASAIFWGDGAVRVGGREYNGLVQSACYTRGSGEHKLTCLGCHSMHDAPAAGQIAPARAGDAGCTSCHESVRADLHSHHPTGSAGAACVSCHMPKTSFALLSGVRSHRIDSPSVASTVATGRPNACNLCHLDQPLSWTARWLAEWYRQPAGVLAAPAGRFSGYATALEGGLAGDAGVRALVADALGSNDAEAATHASALRLPLLETIVREDPYPAVRFIAERSRAAILARPGVRPAPLAEAAARALGLEPDGRLDPECVRRLLAVQDRRAITIAE